MRRSILLAVLLGGRFVRSAIDIDGNQVVDPIAEEDPSPISDINTYYPQQHDCPLPCTDYANIHSWVTYFSVDRLRRCPKPMLLQLSVSQSLNDPDATTLIRSCTLGESGVSVPENLTAVENPKTTNALAIAKLETEATCVTSGVEVSDKVQLFAGGAEQEEEEEDNGRAAALIKGMQDFFSTHENCDERFVFGYYNDTVAGVYIGDSLGKGTIQSSLKSLADNYASGSFPAYAAAQVCYSNGTDPGHVFGVTIESSRDLASVQETAVQWSKGHCFHKDGVSSVGDLPGAKVLQIAMGENSTLPSNATHSHAARHFSHKSAFGLHSSHGRHTTQLDKRATCSYITVAAGDTCPSLVKRCGIANTDFVKYNPRSGLCAAGTLKQGDFVCCSAGDLPSATPVAPKPGSDGVCATHLIQNGDTCTTLSARYGVTVDNLEKWNKKKTWAWTKCEDMLLGYNMCVSDGFAPMPPPAQGAECGPLVPGTPALTDRSISLADLNPCPLKACCSNWGYCGVFEGHCAIHAPPDSGPGTKLKEFQNSCVSNCDNKIKTNSAAPTQYERIGYYESWNMNRDCLWLKSEDANTDGTYTHIHWSFAEIDPITFKVIIKDEHKQWDGFKKLKNVKHIVSFGGWAYSTEEPGASILRRAIIDNRNLFATNLAQFAQEEGIEGIDIDWEYPGAPDIAIGGSVISQKTDGIEYLKFLTVLKQKMGTKLVSIAAPASYWYLKAFPIDRIASVIDYIVYMTYDLHGQWDYGNPNSFDSCDSGKCIRSHVNLTETDNALAMITKAGVPNNKIFVGESSYGRSFRMAKPGCWSSMCEFTGTRTLSDATPGRCTNTSGYLAQAEINELMARGSVRRLFDPSSSTNVIIWDGNYVSFLDEDSKLSRRERWKNLNFAGTIDWAVDLQAFSNADMEIPERPSSGKGCISGLDLTLNTWDLCEFTCKYGFCPETLCECRAQGDLLTLPRDQGEADIEAWSPADVEITRLCKFACKYGYCPDDVCPAVVNDDEVDDSGAIIEQTEGNSFTKRDKNAKACTKWKGLSQYDNSLAECKKVCQPQLDAAAVAGRTSNYGCQANIDPTTGGITWNRVPNGYITAGTCLCDNWLMNEVADTVLEAMPMIAQISCYVLMSSLKFVLDVGAQFVPVVGQALDIGLDMAATAAQMAAYLYPDEEDPEGAFSWWLQPCGGTDLVPEDFKKLFDTLSTLADGVSSFKTPKNLKKGSGKKGDEGNPHESDRSNPRSTNNKPTKSKCIIRPKQDSKAWGKGHIWQKQECKNDQTHITQYIVTSLVYANNAPTTTISKECSKKWEQACYHYSSAIDVNPAWATQPCHAQAAVTSWRPEDKDLVATSTWSVEHNGKHWTSAVYRVEKDCHRDEYPPAYFLYPGNPIMVNGGKQSDAQLVRWLRGEWNIQAANMWKGTCFLPPLKDWTEKDYLDAEKKDLAKLQGTTVKSMGKQNSITKHITTIQISGTAQKIPEFTITKWPTPPAGSEKGLLTNECWPKRIAPLDPGFVLLAKDPYYVNKVKPYKYHEEMVRGSNGAP